MLKRIALCLIIMALSAGCIQSPPVAETGKAAAVEAPDSADVAATCCRLMERL